MTPEGARIIPIPPAWCHAHACVGMQFNHARLALASESWLTEGMEPLVKHGEWLVVFYFVWMVFPLLFAAIPLRMLWKGWDRPGAKRRQLWLALGCNVLSFLVMVTPFVLAWCFPEVGFDVMVQRGCHCLMAGMALYMFPRYWFWRVYDRSDAQRDGTKPKPRYFDMVMKIAAVGLAGFCVFALVRM